MQRNLHIYLIILFLALFQGFKISAQTNFVLPKENHTFLNSENIVFEINGNTGSSHQVQFSASSSFSSLILDTVVNSTNFQRRFSGSSGAIWLRTKEVSALNWSPTRKMNLVNFPIGQRLWLRSDSVEITGGKVAQWYDRSGNNNHAIQATAASRPIRPSSSPNLAIPAIKFDGVDDFLTGTTLAGIQNSSMTAFILLNGYSQSDNGGLLTIGNLNQGFGLYRGTYYQRFTMLNNYGSNSLVFDIPDAMPNSGFPFKLYGMTKNFGVSAQMHGNGVTGSTNSTPTLVGAFTNSNYEISGGPLGKLNGEIAEVMLFDQVLSTPQRNSIESYMMDRYAPPVNLGSDIISTYGFCNITIQPTNQIYTSYLWSTNSNASSISINQPGQYWVQTVDVFGRTSRDTINVFRPVYNQIALQNELVCAGQPESYSAPIPSGAYSFVSWSDGVTTPTRTISSAQTLSYTVQDNSGCQRTSNTVQITLDASLVNMSVGNDTSLCAGNAIGLVQNLSGSVNYTWNTGNTQPTQLVDTSGTYILQVSNSNGCQKSDDIAVVVVGVAPILNFSISTQSCQGGTFTFWDSSTVALPSTISSTVWHFQDQPDFTGTNGTISYQDSGYFTGSIEVFTQQGCTNSANFSIYSSPLPILEIQKSYSCSPGILEITASNLTGIDIANFVWTLTQNGVISQSSQDTVLFTLNSNDELNIQLSVVDELGCSSQIASLFPIAIENTIQLTTPSNNVVLSSSDVIPFSWTDFPYDAISAEYTIEIASDSLFVNLVHQQTIGQSNLTYSPSSLSGFYFWRAKRCYSQNWTQIRKFQIVNLSAGQRLWLRSDSLQIVNGKIAQWYDRSGNGFHAIQNTVSSRPTLSSLSPLIAHSAVKFDGVDDFLSGPTIPGIQNSSMTAFIVVNGYSQTDNGGLFTINDLNQGFGLYRGTTFERFTVLNNYASNNLVFDFPNSIPNVGFPFKVFGITKNFGVNAQLHGNGISGVINTTPSFVGAFTNSNYQISGGPLGKLNGEIAEVILYDQALTSIERKLVENYLMDRYAPPVNLGADINSTYGFCDISLQPINQIYTSYLWSNNATSSSIAINEPGTYWVQAVDVFGRTSRDTINVFRPVFDQILMEDEAVCFGQSETFSAPIPAGNYTFIQWNDGLTNPTRIIDTVQSISFTIQDSLGCQRSSNLVQIVIDSSLMAISLGADTALCAGNSISLESAPSGNLSYLWNTQNISASQVVDTSGTYILQVTNQNSCSNTDEIYVEVVGIAPTLNFDFPSQVCQGSTVNFSDSSSVPLPNEINEVVWHIENHPDYIGASGSIVFNDSGTYQCELEVRTTEGCNNNATFQLTVFPKPVISFTTEKYCPNEFVLFSPINSVSTQLFNFNWSGDSGNFSSNSSEPSFLFGAAGNYEVTLNVIDQNGCKDTVVQNVSIQEGPVVDFSIVNPCEKQTVEFINGTSISDTLSISNYQWNISDGASSSDTSFTNVFAEYGDFQVSLVAIASNGCRDTIERTVPIHPIPNLAWEVGPACKNTWTTFENLSSIDSGNVGQTDWLVNLQYALEGTSSAYKFVTTGVQYLNLTSISDQGCASDTLIIVNVQPEINAAFSVSPSTVVAGIPIVLSNTGFGGSQYEWNLGDGNIIQTSSADPIEALGFDASNIGDSSLIYLAIENNIGCKDTAYKYLKVNEPRVDLAINQLFVQDINGFYKVGVELHNLGFVEITQTDLLLKAYNSSPILETDIEPILPGESHIYLFNASPSAFISTQDNEISYLCMEAISYNDYQLIETELSNNISCVNTEGGNFVLLPIYPNPTNDDITYTLIVSKESTITSSLSDETGRIVESNTEHFTSGLHTPIISMRNLRAGMYYFQISDGVTSKTVKVLKN
jgi:hypothetical protein